MIHHSNQIQFDCFQCFSKLFYNKAQIGSVNIFKDMPLVELQDSMYVLVTLLEGNRGLSNYL